MKPLLRDADPRLMGLRNSADFASYKPNPTAPDWLIDLEHAAERETGVWALLGPTGVSVPDKEGRRIRLAPEPLGLFLAGVASRLRWSGRRIAVGLPPTGKHLPLFIASTAVLSNSLDSLSPSSTARGGVLLISPDLDLRSRYGDLFVGKAKLDDAYPGCRMRPDGQVLAISSGKNPSNDGVCFFLPRLLLPQTVGFHPSLVLLDLRYGHWHSRVPALDGWIGELARSAGVIALYSLEDREAVRTLTSSKYSNLPFDHTAIITASQQIGRPPPSQEELTIDIKMSKAAGYLSRRHEIHEVGVADTIEDLLARIGETLHDNSRSDSLDLHRAHWLYAVLGQLPVPLGWYEQCARGLGRSTLKRLIGQLGIWERRTSGVGSGAVWQSLRMMYEQLYMVLESSSPRAEFVKTLLPQLVAGDSSGDILVLVRDNVFERALSSWLELDVARDAKWLSRVQVKSCSSYATVADHQYSTVLVNGALPRRHRWIVGAALGRSVHFVALKGEVDAIEDQLLGVYGSTNQRQFATQRRIVIGSLDLGVTRASAGQESPAPPLQLTRPKKVSGEPAQPQEKPKTVARSLQDLAQAMDAAQKKPDDGNRERELRPIDWSQWDVDTEEEPPEEEQVTERPAQVDDVFCVGVRVASPQGQRGMYFIPETDAVDCVRTTKPDEIVRVEPSELRVGDVILHADEGGRESLFDRLVDLAEAQPQLQYLTSYRRAWREAVQKMQLRYTRAGIVQYELLLRKLQEAGAMISSETAVSFWVRDLVIGPGHVSSIEAVGRVSGVDVLVRNAKDFDRAFRVVRSIHQTLGRRLNAMIRRSFSRFGDVAESPVDSGLDWMGLPLDELLETVDMLEVCDSVKLRRRILPGQVRRFLLS